MIQSYEEAVKNISKELKSYLQESKLKSLILGVSGGIDSTLCAALARPVCDSLQIPLICRSITISTNKPDEIYRAQLTGEAFAHDFQEVNLSSTFEHLLPQIFEDSEKEDPTSRSYKLRQGNLKARMRMLYLYDLAAKHKGLVLSTDNYTELQLGFWTLHGDVGDYGMLQNIWKTEVYEMSEYLCRQFEGKAQKALRLGIEATPTDGLGITNSDFEQIGVSSYQEADRLLIAHLKDPQDANLLTEKIIQRKRASEFKRNNPFNIPREKITSTPLF